MSTLHKFKAYFGMVPLEDYEDDYLDDPSPARRPRVRETARGPYGERDQYEDSPYRDGDPGYPEPVYKSAYSTARRDEFETDRYEAERYDADRYDAVRRPSRLEPLPQRSPSRPGPSSVSRPVTRGALAVDPAVERRIDERRAPVFDDGGPLSKIITLRPRDYTEARTIGERFRDGTPVIVDLVEMSNADAKRVVDFAAGLAFGLRGSFDKVATKVFLLAPADIDVSAEERRRLAETGFYNQQ